MELLRLHGETDILQAVRQARRQAFIQLRGSHAVLPLAVSRLSGKLSGRQACRQRTRRGDGRRGDKEMQKGTNDIMKTVKRLDERK